MPDHDDRNDMSDDEDGGKSSGRTKSRRELPTGAVATLKAWLLSPEHFTHPYPTPQDQVMLMQKTGIDKKQLKNWFTNARRRIWKPMLKKQLEQGKLQATGGGGVAVPGVVPGLMALPGSVVQQQQDSMYQQAPIPAQQELQVDAYGNPVYGQAPAPMSHAIAPAPQYYDPNGQPVAPLPATSSIASLPLMGHSASGVHLSKTDSHAVLMELFARDQDLVRQATESAGVRKAQPEVKSPIQRSQPAQPQAAPLSQHPMKSPSQARLSNVPTLNSWPHFSSVSSLNNLGTMPGVKSITSLSCADLAKQGPVNTVSNLAQVKSVESMGKNDSYAFLEVFFEDRSSNPLGGNQRGVKREREEDNDVGLSLEDEVTSAATPKRDESSQIAGSPSTGLFAGDEGNEDSTGTLKRAYDDALAARGLLAVSRSCEKLTDLALPPKIRRTLSQELLRDRDEPRQPPPATYQYSAPPPVASIKTEEKTESPQSQQYPGQHPVQGSEKLFASDGSNPNASVEVPSATKCAICHQTNVDTQLRPCGHMFHERCLKPSLQGQIGPPRCPIDHIPMQSALLAVPTDENATPRCTPVPVPTEQPAAWTAPLVAQGKAVATDTKQ